MQERGIVGLEARAADGTVLGRITELLQDEGSGELTHVLVRTEDGEEREVPIHSLTLDPEADADATDDRPEGYAPLQGEVDDAAHDNQLVTEPTDPDEALSAEEARREAGEAGGWEDEDSNTPESGYPRNDAYIDPDSGEVSVDPALEDSEDLAGDVRDLVDGTGLEVRSARDGVVELSGTAPSAAELEETVAQVMELEGVLEVDTTDVEVEGA